MKKKKVLRIIARLNIGGPAIHAVLLTEGLDKSKFDSVLVCGKIGKFEGDMAYYALDRNIRPIFIPELKREIDFFSDINAFRKIYYIIKTECPDIVHTHTAKAGAVGRLAAIAYNFLHPFQQTKIFHTFHGHIFDGYFGRFKTGIFILIEQFLALFTCKIIAVSESIKKELISFGVSGQNKIEVIPLGLELDKFLNIPERSEDILNIGIIGRLVPIKNHYLFLAAVAKIISDNPGIQMRFKIIGDGELRNDLERYATNLGIRERVEFLGWQRSLVKVYSNLDIVALTSINEGTPVSLIEAMASGKVVVSTNVGGVSDLLGNPVDSVDKVKGNFKILERGIIVDSMDSLSFSGALIFISKNSDLRKRMGMLGRDFAVKNFTSDRLMRDIENLYMKVENG
jgi:glycosyltransferase involved in cell wall biosynthesis